MILISTQNGTIVNLNHMVEIVVVENKYYKYSQENNPTGNYYELRMFTNNIIDPALANRDYCILWSSDNREVVEDKLQALTSYLNIHINTHRLFIKMSLMTNNLRFYADA